MPNSLPAPARRARRRADRQTRRRPAILAAGLAFAVLATAGLTATTPASGTEASSRSANFVLASYATPAPAATGATAADTEQITVQAEEALAQATATLTAASTVATDIAASGLDIGTPTTSVDTAALETAAARLDAADSLPAPFVPDLTDDVTALVAAVEAEVSGLRGSLDGALALKAAEEAAAAEQARIQAEAVAAEAAAAEAAAQAPSAPAAPSGSPTPSYASGGSSAGEAQAIAHGMVAGRGWGEDQFACLVALWNRESGWNVFAANPSGAYGIPQALPGSKMASAGADWQTSAATQVSWGLGYIGGRYGSPCGAWSHSESNGWY